MPDENIFIDKQSGKDFNRPQYKKLLRKVKEDDLIYIKSIGRLGRNYDEILEQWKVLTKDKRVDLYVIDMPLLDTRSEKNLLGTFSSDLVLTLLSDVDENERINIRQSQAEGIAAAKARGVHFGRRPNPLPENFYEVYQKWKMKKISVSEAGAVCPRPPSLTRLKHTRNPLCRMRSNLRNYVLFRMANFYADIGYHIFPENVVYS